MRSDAELVFASRDDAGAFRELYERYDVRVHAFHARRVGDADAALDLTAETFAQAWFARRRYRDEAGGSAGPWLYGIARNLIAESVRRRRVELAACARLGILERLDGSAPALVPGAAWLDDPELPGLDEAWGDLPDGQRRALELRVLDDLSYDRVAAELQTTPAAARVRVTRGLGFLRQRLLDKEALR
jgi:RNA polymerase sigma-70 factor (ECF subfamily)